MSACSVLWQYYPHQTVKLMLAISCSIVWDFHNCDTYVSPFVRLLNHSCDGRTKHRPPVIRTNDPPMYSQIQQEKEELYVISLPLFKHIFSIPVFLLPTSWRKTRGKEKVGVYEVLPCSLVLCYTEWPLACTKYDK